MEKYDTRWKKSQIAIFKKYLKTFEADSAKYKDILMKIKKLER